MKLQPTQRITINEGMPRESSLGKGRQINYLILTTWSAMETDKEVTLYRLRNLHFAFRNIYFYIVRNVYYIIVYIIKLFIY